MVGSGRKTYVITKAITKDKKRVETGAVGGSLLEPVELKNWGTCHECTKSQPGRKKSRFHLEKDTTSESKPVWVNEHPHSGPLLYLIIP